MFKLKAISVFALALAPTVAAAGPVVFSGSGPNPAGIQASVDAFRGALGNPNNGNAPGALNNGRREINWDGGNPALINGTPAVTPFNVFRNTRGASFTTPGTGLTQAADTGGALALDSINASYAAAFQTFSPSRLFAPIGSNITVGEFSIPGTNGGVEAFLSGFGAVFTDVDLADTTTIEYFAANGSSLGKFSVPIFDNGLSFLGVLFTEGRVIDRIVITTGNAALGPNESSTVDVVAMDDFIYSEPLPEPATWALMALGLGGLLVGYRRRLTQ